MQMGCTLEAHGVHAVELEHELKLQRPGRKSKRLLKMWPAIQQKLAQGVSHAEILELLNRNGLELTRETYRSYVRRFRKRQKGSAAERSSNAVTAPRAQPIGRAEKPQPAGTGPQRPRTFDYDPRGIPDLLK